MGAPPRAHRSSPSRRSHVTWAILGFAGVVLAGPVGAESPPQHLFTIQAGTDRACQMAQAADGRIYIADAYRHRVLLYSESGQYLSQFGSYGDGPGQLNVPSGVAFDPAGNIYIAEQFNNRIQKFSPSGLSILTFGSSGTGPGELSAPTTLGFSPDGTVLYVTEYLGNRVSMFDTDGRFLGSFGADGN